MAQKHTRFLFAIGLSNLHSNHKSAPDRRFGRTLRHARSEFDKLLSLLAQALTERANGSAQCRSAQEPVHESLDHDGCLTVARLGELIPHGGRFEVESRVSEGSVFNILLPVKGADEADGS